MAGAATEQRRQTPCGDHSDPKPTTSGAGPRSPASPSPGIGNASGGGGRKPNPIPRPRGGGEPHLGPGLENSTHPAEGGGSAREPLQRSAPSIVPLGPAGRARMPVHARTHTRTQIHTHTRTHTPARSTLPRTLPPAPAAHDSDPPPRGPDPAGRLSQAQKRVHTRSHAPRDPSGGSRTATCLGIRAHADPRAARAQSSPRSIVFFMNENVVCK